MSFPSQPAAKKACEAERVRLGMEWYTSWQSREDGPGLRRVSGELTEYEERIVAFEIIPRQTDYIVKVMEETIRDRDLSNHPSQLNDVHVDWDGINKHLQKLSDRIDNLQKSGISDFEASMLRDPILSGVVRMYHDADTACDKLEKLIIACECTLERTRKHDHSRTARLVEGIHRARAGI